jgi:hypothetical protein
MIVQSNDLRKVWLACTLFLVLCGCTGKSVLNQIETYKAPAYPVQQGDLIDRETYDYRLRDGAPNPPSFTDTLICDLWRRMIFDLDIKGINEHRVTEQDVQRAIRLYIEKDWQHIDGYRPWTHSNFLRGLSTSEKNKLASEVVQYMVKYGVQEASPK